MKTYKLLLLLGCTLFVSCNDFLDRPPVDKFTDEEFWQTETQARLFLYSIYPTLFGGFGTAQNPFGGWKMSAMMLYPPPYRIPMLPISYPKLTVVGDLPIFGKPIM